MGITDIDGKRVSYIYDSRHMLTDAADIDGYHVKYEYYGTSPYRVKKITEYAGTTEGNSLTLTYGYNLSLIHILLKKSQVLLQS